MENVSLSFLVDDLVQHRGGAGANMAYGLGLLGLQPVLVGAVGNDFADYDAWLTRHGVDTASVHWSEFKHTARFVCTTDAVNNQIASFYSGAMSEASQIELAPVARGSGPSTSSSSGPTTRRRWSGTPRSAAHAAIQFVADPSQQLAWADGAMIRGLVDGADVAVHQRVRVGPAPAEDRLDRGRGAGPRRHLGHHARRRGRPGPAGRRVADHRHRRSRDQARGADRRRRRAAGRLHRRPHVGPRPRAGHPARLGRGDRRRRGDRHPGVRPAAGELPRPLRRRLRGRRGRRDRTAPAAEVQSPRRASPIEGSSTQFR